MIRSAAGIATVLLLSAGPGVACERDARVDAVATAWLEHREQQPLEDLDLSQGVCFRSHLMEQLAKTLGPVVGYKVGVYTAAARKNYGADTPVVGVLRQQMLVDEGTPIRQSSGVALVSEADFVLVVKDDGINAASTREQAYRHLRGFRPFVELPDLNYRADVKASLGQLVALNVNARSGVLGKEVPLPQSPAGMQALGDLSVDVTVEGAAESPVRARGVARKTLGDPLEIVLAARDGLQREGVRLRAGDLISIGTLTPPRPVKAGETLRIRYHVLAGPAQISVQFVP